MRHGQRGITFIGLVCLLVVLGFFAYAGIRLVPVYLTYMQISRTMEQVATEFKGDNPDQGRMRTSLERHWGVEDISVIGVKDIEIKKENDVVTMHAMYDATVPYVGNVSLLVSFDKTVKVE
jgi:hypothetical protein